MEKDIISITYYKARAVPQPNEFGCIRGGKLRHTFWIRNPQASVWMLMVFASSKFHGFYISLQAQTIL